MGPGAKNVLVCGSGSGMGGWDRRLAARRYHRMPHWSPKSKVVPNELLPKRASSAEEGTNTLPN